MPLPKIHPNSHISYHVGLKILLRKEDEFLFLQPALGSRFDLPGGRISKEERETPLHEILKREVQEELGGALTYHLGPSIFQYRRYFQPLNLNVFLNVYEANFLSGNILLSPEHKGYQWINPLEFLLKENHFLSKEEYLGFKNYFQRVLKKENA